MNHVFFAILHSSSTIHSSFFSDGKDFTGVHITLEKLLVQVLLGALNVSVPIHWGLF